MIKEEETRPRKSHYFVAWILSAGHCTCEIFTSASTIEHACWSRGDVKAGTEDTLHPCAASKTMYCIQSHTRLTRLCSSSPQQHEQPIRFHKTINTNKITHALFSFPRSHTQTRTKPPKSYTNIHRNRNMFFRYTSQTHTRKP